MKKDVGCKHMITSCNASAKDCATGDKQWPHVVEDKLLCCTFMCRSHGWYKRTAEPQYKSIPYVTAASGMIAARLEPMPVYRAEGPSLVMMLPNAAVMPWL